MNHRRFKTILTPLILVALSSWFCVPLLFDMRNLGVRDWDQHLFYFASFLKSLEQYNQFPLWNPWYCGGSVLFQNPQIPLISPAYLLSLLMPLSTAMKLNILLHYFIALTGFVAIARIIFQFSDLFLVVCAASVFVFNSFFSLQISEGHTWILTAAYIPVAYLGFESYLKNGRAGSIILGAAAFALMVLSGGIYPAPYMALFLCSYAGIRSFVERTARPLKTLALFGAYSFLFSAVKLIPVVDYMVSYPRLAGERESVSISAWVQIFFGRDQTLLSAKDFPGKIWGWHEYGCYIGVAYGLLLMIVALRTLMRFRHARNQPRELSLLLCLFGFLTLFAGDFAYVTPYTILRHLPGFSSMHAPGRFLIIVTFISALLFLDFARALMPKLIRNSALKKTVYGVCALLVINLIYVNSKTFKDAFTIDPSHLHDENGFIPDAASYVAVNDLPRYGDVYSSMYAGLLRNQYVVDCYEPVKPKLGFELGRALVFSRDRGITVTNIRFSPDRVLFDVRAVAKGRVYLNQNYVRGWSLTNSDFVVEADDDKPSFLAGPGSYQDLAFYFLPKSIFWGSGLTLIGLVVAALHLGYVQRRLKAKQVK